MLPPARVKWLPPNRATTSPPHATTATRAPIVDAFGETDVPPAAGLQLPHRMGTAKARETSEIKSGPGKPRAEDNDLARILALPRVEDVMNVPDLTDELRTPMGKMRLLPVQNAALWWARETGGLAAPAGVGSGKSLLSYLLPILLNKKRPLLMVPAHLVEKTRREMRALRLHWKIPDPYPVLSYSRIQIPSGADLLDDLRPDLIVADEAHYLKIKASARTKRFIRYMDKHPECAFCPLSGTFTLRSLADYAHLMRFALGDGSPVPLKDHVVEEYDQVFGAASDQRTAWVRFNMGRGPRPPSAEDLGKIGRRYVTWAGNPPAREIYADDPEGLQADPCGYRAAFRARLVSTPGVVSTRKASCDASIVMVRHNPAVPDAVRAALVQLESTWTRPDGEELLPDGKPGREHEFENAMHLSECRSQMAAGFYYRWDWPGGVPDVEWIGRKAAWHRALRAFLKEHDRSGYDSPFMLARAANQRDPFVEELWAPWVDWCEVKGRPAPPVVAVWIDEFLMREAVALATKENAVIWYNHSEVGRKLAEISGFAWFGPGKQASAQLVQLAETVLDGTRKPMPIVCSARAHREGKNLQGWERFVWCELPTTGNDMEQIIGRFHRQGQQADEVRIDWFGHAECFVERLDTARRDCGYQEGTLDNERRLRLATYIDATDLGHGKGEK
ncbi:MAG: hypothetical protein WC700_14965 [Gemmatimonadaceae bacterium]